MIENIWIKFVLVVQVLVGRSACCKSINGEPSDESLSEETISSNTDYDIARVLHPKRWTSIHMQKSDSFIKRNAETFEQLITNNVIVDKSLLIKRIFGDSVSDHLLITGPRKWGKSTNLRMLQTFAEKLNTNGDVMVREKTIAYNYFQNGKCLQGRYNEQDVNRMIDMTEPPLITKYETVIKQHLLQYSVIYLDFTMRIPSTFQEFLILFQENIIKSFKEKQYLRKKLRDINTEESTEMLTKFDRIMDTSHHAPDSRLLINSLELFCTCIRTCYPELPILILIDEYDLIFNEIFLSGDVDHNNPEVKLMIDFFSDFMRNSFRSYKISAYQYSKVILTGICKLIKANLFTSLSNFEEWTMIEVPNIYPFYGFTANEVNILLEKRGRLADNGSVYERYDGYRPFSHLSRPLFNPISMISYLNAKILKSYWIQTGSKLSIELPKLFKSFQIRFVFQPFLTNVKILRISENAINPSLAELKEISDLRRADELTKPLSDLTIDCVIGVLLSTGYLSLSEHQATYGESDYIYVTIPNQEIEDYFVKELHKYCYHLQDDYTSPIENAAVAFGNYFYSNNDDQFPQLETSLEQLFSAKGLYENAVTDFKQFFYQKSRIPDEQMGFLSNNEAAAHHIIFETLLKLKRKDPSISLGTECSFDYTSPVLNREYKYRIDLIMWRRDTVMIIEMKGDKTKTLDDIMSQARTYLLLFVKRKFEIYKLIGINVLDNGGVPNVKLKQEILSQQDVQAYYDEFNIMEEKAMRSYAKAKKIEGEKAIQMAWRKLSPQTVRDLIEEATKMPKSDLLVPPNFENKLPANLRCDPTSWSAKDVDSFFAFCKEQFKLTSVEEYHFNGEMLVVMDQKQFETMCQKGGGLRVFNAFQYMLKKYSTDQTQDKSLQSAAVIDQPTKRGKRNPFILKSLFQTLDKPKNYANIIEWEHDSGKHSFKIKNADEFIKIWTGKAEVQDKDRTNFKKTLGQFSSVGLYQICNLVGEKQSPKTESQYKYEFIYNTTFLKQMETYKHLKDELDILRLEQTADNYPSPDSEAVDLADDDD